MSTTSWTHIRYVQEVVIPNLRSNSYFIKWVITFWTNGNSMIIVLKRFLGHKAHGIKQFR